MNLAVLDEFVEILEVAGSGVLGFDQIGLQSAELPLSGVRGSASQIRNNGPVASPRGPALASASPAGLGDHAPISSLAAF